MQQLSLLKSPPLFHGGSLSRGKRKTLRPLSSKHPIHLVLKAKKSLLYKNKLLLVKEIRSLEKRFSLKLYGLAVNHDHLHLVLKIKNRKNYVAFIRSFTSFVAKRLGKGIWALLPFTRVAGWGKEFRLILRYLEKNRKETMGEVPYMPRPKNRYG